MHKTSYKLLLIFSALAAIGGVITLLPAVHASYPNIIGYKSLCTFTPAASLFCFLAAGISCFIRSTFIKDQSGTPAERLKRHVKSFIPLAFVLAAALVCTVIFMDIKSEYTHAADEITAASESFE